MKLLLLIVSAIAVISVHCGDDLRDDGLPIEYEFQDSIETDVPKNRDSADENILLPVELESYITENEEKQQKRNWVIAEGPDKFEFSKEESSEEEKEGPNVRTARRSRCKARNACVVMAGFCVTNATLCSGRLVPEGCKGTNCQCCVPGTFENKIQDLENEIQSMQTNLNATKTNMNMTLKLMEDKLMDSISNISSKLDYYMEHAGCPHGFFTTGSGQCFKHFNTTRLSWTSAKAKCQSEGLALAKPIDAPGLKMHIKDTDGSYHTWIGARGAGSYFKWDRDGQQISNANSLWYSSHPGSQVSTSYCLAIAASDNNDYTPYFAFSCSNARPFVCERVMN